MSDLKRFEVPAVADLVENYEELEIYAYRDGYRDCLSQTNAKELYEALQGLMREAEHEYPKLTKSGVWPQYEKAKAAISKATEKPQ